MINVDTELLEDRQARLTATVEPERLEREMRQAARRIAGKTTIPGFRKGKAPYQVILNYYGEEVLFEEALEGLGQAVYGEALEQSGLQPYAPGVLNDLQREPLVLTFTVPLLPEVDLGDYRALRLPYEEQEVTDEDVERALDDIRDQQATLDPVERPLQMGDVALLDIVGTWVRDEEPAEAEAEVDADEAEAEGEEEAETEPEQKRNDTWLARKGVRVKISEDSTYPVPGFPEQVLGMEPGEQREFQMSFPDDDEDLAEALRGKTLAFDVTCAEIYEYTAPELDDEFAKDLGDYEDLEALKTEIRAQIADHYRQEARDEYIGKVMDELIDSVATLAYPPVMVEEQIDHMLEDFDQQLRQQGLNLDEYKRLNNLTDEQIRADLDEQARRQLGQALILGELAEVEQLSVREEEINDEIETAILPYGEQAALARQLFSSPEARRQLRNRILAQKSVDRLIAIAKGEEPPIGEPEPEPEASDADEADLSAVMADVTAEPADMEASDADAADLTAAIADVTAELAEPEAAVADAEEATAAAEEQPLAEATEEAAAEAEEEAEAPAAESSDNLLDEEENVEQEEPPVEEA